MDLYNEPEEVQKASNLSKYNDFVKLCADPEEKKKIPEKYKDGFVGGEMTTESSESFDRGYSPEHPAWKHKTWTLE